MVIQYINELFGRFSILNSILTIHDQINWKQVSKD
jgi:hypothetical protein